MGYENSKRRYARPGRRQNVAGVKDVKASTLAQSAGQNASGFGAERATVEQLERRQMLFSLSVTADTVDSSTGLGQARAYFGYVPPILASNFRASFSPATDQVENFNDEVIGPVANNQLMTGSGIRIRSNIVPANDLSISATPLSNDNPEKYLRVNPKTVGEFFEYRFYSDTDTGAVPVSATKFSVDVAGDGPTDGTGLYNQSMRIELLQGDTVVSTIQGTNNIRNLFVSGTPAVGIGTMTINAPTNVVAFSGIRFVLAAAPGAGNSAFRMDNATFTPAQGAWAGLNPIRGVALVLTGPVGTSVTLTDLFGRDMVRSIRLGKPEGSQATLVDSNDDGVPDFNYGIGTIRLSGTDQRTSLRLWGGTINETNTPTPNSEFVEPGFEFILDDDLAGSFSELEQSGVGFGFDIRNGNYVATGLPSVGGSIIVGSPFRTGSTSAIGFGIIPGATQIQPATNTFLVTSGFTDPTQGIFIDDGSSIGEISIAGAVMGSSRFTGAVGRLNIGYLLGSVSVAGDLGQLNVASDAGAWEVDPGFTLTNATIDINRPIKTGAQLFVGRTVGEINIAGRSLMDVTVLGDTSSPTTRPPLFNAIYNERETIFGVTTNVSRRTLVQASLYATDIGTASNSFIRNGSTGATGLVPYAGLASRNDALLSAEWIGSSSSSARIRGDVGGLDTFNTGEDKADVYAFAVDGLSEIQVEMVSWGGPRLPNFRLVDQDGRLLGATRRDFPLPTFTDTQLNPTSLPQIRYKPTTPGVVYLIVSDTRLTTDASAATDPYLLNVTGMATTTMGAFRTAGGAPGNAVGVGFAPGAQGSVTVLSGNVGSFRIGTGLFGNASGEESPLIAYNDTRGVDESMDLRSGSLSVAGNLYNITTGSDISATGLTVNVGGNFGTLYTGLSQLLGVGPTQGDVTALSLTVGGSVALLDVRGGVGVDQDTNADAAGLMLVRTGVDTRLRGDIGMIRTGYRVFSDTLRIITPSGSDIGAVLLSQDTYTNGASGARLGTFGVPMTTGAGSNIKFFDTPQLDLLGQVNSTQPIFGSTPVTLTDDGGATVVIDIPDAPTNQILGSIIYMPVDGTQGGVIAQIAVNLNASQGGAVAGWRLRVQSSNPAAGSTGGSTGSGSKLGTVGIGRIVVLDGNIQSTIELGGQIETDVFRIVQTGGDAVGFISNNTPDGDFVAIDVAGLDTLETNGDIGRTELPAWGPQQLGPWLGVASQFGTTVNDPMGFPVAAPNGGRLIDPNFGGTRIQRGVNDDSFNGGDATIDDTGAPFDGYLNGVVVRTGNVTVVRANGAVGDVILQGTTSVLGSVSANRDRTNTTNRFDGIIGGLFAKDIGIVDIGMGSLAVGSTGYATSSIVGWNTINSVSSSTPNATLRGVVVAGGADPVNTPFGQIQGLTSVNFTNGSINGAYIASGTIDGFWYGSDVYGIGTVNGSIGSISVANGNIFDAEFVGLSLDNLRVTSGFLDASGFSIYGDVGTIDVEGMRNSTRLGFASEQRQMVINVGQSLGSLRIGASDMSDSSINIVNSITGSITAPNVTRSSINVANILTSFAITGDMKASSIVVGALPNFNVAKDVVSSSVTVSGKLASATVLGQVSNSSFAITGPDGEFTTLVATKGFSGEISATGPIGSISVPAGDLRGKITTTTTRGSINTITASGDIAIQSDIAGKVTSITAGRNIGDRSVGGSIVIRSDLTTLNAPNGQLYADLRVNGTLGAATLGAASAKPGSNLVGSGSIVASGRIASVVINGDFGGSIISYSGGIGAVAINEGSLLPGTIVQSVAGSISSFIITNGNLYGNVKAEYDITLLRVLGRDGVFGDIGVSPLKSASVSYDARRNQLPVGVAIDGRVNGPRITAGHDIVAIEVPNGFVFETQFRAGRAIKNVVVGGTIGNDGVTAVRGSWLAAGDSIDNVIAGGIFDTNMYAGVIDLGADDAPGGTGVNADTVRAGVIRTVNALGGAANDSYYAGVTPGANGRYGDSDDRFAIGSSSINTLAMGGSTAGIVASTEVVSAAIAGDARITKVVPAASTSSLLDSGTGTPGTAFSGTQSFTAGSQVITIAFTGPGQAFFQFVVSDQSFATPRLTLRNTTSASTVTVVSNVGTLTNFDVVTNNNASLGSLNFLSDVTGDSDILIDNNLGTLTTKILGGTGNFVVGGVLNAANLNAFTGGFLDATSAGAIAIGSDFGASNSAVVGEARIDLITAGPITIGGANRALISVERDAASISVTGAADRAQIRVGGTLGTLTAGSLSQSLVGVVEGLTSATIAGDMFDSDIAAGVNLGTDAAFGGTGRAADSVTTSSVVSVKVGGNFRESDVTAGYLRGTDGYFGTTDDVIASGRSSIGSVTIGGSQVGSVRNSETYVVASSGTLGTVSVGGATTSAPVGNFSTRAEPSAPTPIQVTSLRTDYTGGQYIAQLVFNQAIDFSTASRGINISEVRGSGDVLIRLIEGTDYTLSYDAATRTITATFSRSVTSRNLPLTPGTPGPGVYRFEINQSIFRARAVNARLDGNGDGQIGATDNYSEDTVIGDAGDKINSGIALNSGGGRVDFYGAANLDIALDNNYSPDGLTDANKVFTVRGVIGDHADQDPNYFKPAGDADVYRITLQAGQILRLSPLAGAAAFAGINLLNSTGGFVTSLQAEALQGRPFDIVTDLGIDQNFLIQQTGVYYIVVGDSSSIATTSTVNNNNTNGGEIGAYSFTFQVFEDGDSGFTGPTNAGDGTRLVDAPVPGQFAGPDGTFGTADDRTSLTIGGSTFTWSAGADGIANTADDLVTGGNGSDQSSFRVGTGVATTTVKAAIGLSGAIGVPGVVSPDVDVFHLNNRQPIAAGTRIKLTVKLQQYGADLGSANPNSGLDQRGAVQMGLFETTDSTTQNDGLLVFSPTEFLPFAGTPNKILADNGQTKYGFDANGDFFIEFLAPESQRAAGGNATFAAFVQGLYNTDYALEVVTGGAGERVKVTQNVLLETAGGSVTWLLSGDQSYTVSPFDAATLGFAGTTAGGLSIRQYILSSLVTKLTAIFNNAFPTDASTDLDVRFSTNPADFEFQPFSTVYLTSSTDPVGRLTESSNGLNFGSGNGAFDLQTYGYSQHSDPLNANLRDEAVVFVPSLSFSSKGGQQTEADALVQSLSAAVMHRVGELMGLRVTDANSLATSTGLDPLAVDSPIINRTASDNPVNSVFAISNTSRRLSLPGDRIERSDFFVGRQNAASLLDRVLLRR